MDLEKLEQDVQTLVDDLDEESFIYDLLLAYDLPKATITRLRNGDRNQSKKPGEIIWKKNLCFTDRPEGDLFTCIDALKNGLAIKKHHPRFIVVTDYETFLAIDTRTADSLDIPFAELPKRANFFLPWAGMEKSAITSENPADIKAAEKMGQLYDLLLHNNEIENEGSRHALNVFLSRLLFCFFAEDTGIFDDDQFTKLVDSHTAEDGGNVQPLLQRLFKALNSENRSDYPDYVRAFPYVNGGLFADNLSVPKFSRKARKMLIDCGTLNWQAINPDIFGSMMQAVTLGEERSNIGMHYTSVINIMKVIEPLFLIDLQGQLEKADRNEKKLAKLLDRLYHIRIFDPACGSGNFLIIAYKELCRLEIEIFQRLQELNSIKWRVARSGIQLNQFFGIEIDDFATETARLSLWLSEHQMNLEFRQVFGEAKSTLPLAKAGNITCANAATLDWRSACPVSKTDETYLLGNPPYLGSRNQDKAQKSDMKNVLVEKYRSLDYVSIWFIKAAQYIAGNLANFAFVTTNSICQGEQVGLLWPRVLRNELEIGFACQSFRWTNNAKGSAGVTVVIVGVRNPSNRPKTIFRSNVSMNVKNISPYLVEGATIFVHGRTRPFIDIPKMNFGNMPADGGKFLFTTGEMDAFVTKEPESKPYFRKLISAREFLNGLDRWCLWLDGIDNQVIESMPRVQSLVNDVKIIREESSRPQLAKIPHLFAQITQPLQKSFLLIPRHSSERRAYIPMGYFDGDSIVHDSCLLVAEIGLEYFAILQSRMHMAWVRAVGGRLKTDYRYSAALCYNTFPFPKISETSRKSLNEGILNVLDERERSSEKSLSDLYDPEAMPKPLTSVHEYLDRIVDNCYREKPFDSDEIRLKFLLDRYQKLVGTKRNVRQISA